MRGFLAVLLIFAAIAALVMSPAISRSSSLDADQFGRMVYGGALATLVGTSILWRYRGRFGRMMADLLLWVGLILGLIAAYSYRYELAALRDRVIGELMPGATVIGSGGEVVVTRRSDGNFVVDTKANGVRLPFTFDTGASTVVIRYEDAEKIGIPTAELDFSVPISTANGKALAADASIQTMTVGLIGFRNVPALVSKEGSLRENLLGMTFLGRLASFSVAGDRLTLKGR